MKTNIILILCLKIFIINNLHCQNIYYDAVFLKNSIRKDGKIILYNNIQVLLAPHFVKESNLITIKDFIDNPFLNGNFIDKNAGKTDNSSFTSNKILSSISGLDVTNLADGMAKFIVERVKEELSIAFFEKLKEDIKNEDLKTLFPNTYNVLNTIDQEIYNFSAYLETLREAFLKDFELIIPDLKEMTEKHEADFKNNRKLYALITIALQITDDYQKGVHPGDIIKNLSKSDTAKLNPIDKNLKPTLQVLNLFLQSVRSKQYDQYTVPYDSIVKNLLDDPITFNIYMGLVYQQAKLDSSELRFNSTYFYKLLKPDSIEKVKSLIEEIINQSERIQQALKTINDKNREANNAADYIDYYRFYDASNGLIKLITKITEKFDTIPTIKNKDRLFFYTDKVGEIYLDANRKRYASVVVNLALVYDSVFAKLPQDTSFAQAIHSVKEIIKEGIIDTAAQKQLKTLLNQINNISNVDSSCRDSLICCLNNGEKINSKELCKILLDIKSHKAEMDNILIHDSNKLAIFNSQMTIIQDFIKKSSSSKRLNKLYDNLNSNVITDKKKIKSKIDINRIDRALKRNSAIPKELIIKYGTFAATIAKAETSDDVKNAIEAVALPAGSSRIKRETNFNASLNAYCGISGGQYRTSFWSAPKYSFSITAPIGIATSWGHVFFPKIHTEKGYSTSIFLSLVDIGAITAFRFANDSIETLRKIELKDIISPGLFFSWGIPKCPVSVNLGAQLTPMLSSVSADKNTIDASMFRISASICIDIPLLNFYTKSRY